MNSKSYNPEAESNTGSSKTLRRVLKIYLPYSMLAVIGMALISTPAAVFLGLFFILIQATLWELNAQYGGSLWINVLKLDVSPFAAIFLSYHFSFWAGLVGMIVPVLLQDADRDTCKLADWESVVFNIVVAAAAAFLRFIPFFPLAIGLITGRLLVLLILHYFVFGDINPAKLLSEGTSSLIFLAVLFAVARVVF